MNMKEQNIQAENALKKENIDIPGISAKREKIDFAKLKIGLKKLEDVMINNSVANKMRPVLASKEMIVRAIQNAELENLRMASEFYAKTSGIYSRLCKYLAFLYKYDWLVTPYLNDDKQQNRKKMSSDFGKVLSFLEDFGVKRFLGETALKVIIYGVYNGYIVETDEGVAIQELHPKYCRSRFKIKNRPVLEFNMKFFDDVYKDAAQRMRIIKAFPEEFAKGYLLFKEQKLVPDFQGDTAGWYTLDPEKSIRFNLNGQDYPVFASVIPAILDLDAAQELDRKKMAQQLLKIIIQQIPLDKNGELPFDTDEISELHSNAVTMLDGVIGADVLTTFANVSVQDMADRSSVTSVDELEKVERTVYNESGTAQNLFNSNGNIALNNSILNDEASISNLILQFEEFLNILIKRFNKNVKKYNFKVQILPTTIYNYKELSKSYKELTTLGYSKMLPLIALGQTQSSILATAHFENEVLELANLLIPPKSSNTMSSSDENKKEENKKDTVKIETDENKGGREEKPDNEKSEKTIANRESMN